jgi:hypothetical protein
MSTKAIIILYTPTEKRFLHLACDGGLNAAGAVLRRSYDDLESVRALMGRGDIFSLHDEPSKTRTVAEYCRQYGEPAEDSPARHIGSLDDPSIADWFPGNLAVAYCYTAGYEDRPDGWTYLEPDSIDCETLSYEMFQTGISNSK